MSDVNKNNLQERAIPLENYPDTYLSKRKTEVAKAKRYGEKFNEAIEKIKALNWRDIRFEVRGGDHIIILPDVVTNAIREAHAIDWRKAESDFKKGSYTFKNTFGESHIHMQIDGTQRSHFPNDGIPNKLRGTGLGYKLYRALLQKAKYLKSNTAGTTEKDYAWASIVSPKKDAAGNLTEDDVHAIVGPEFVMAMVKDIPNSEKIRIASAYLRQINMDRLNARNFAIDDELKAILPDDIKALVDVENRSRGVEARRRERYAKYAPFGIDAHNWELGDYIVVKDYLVQLDYQDLPVRKVVQFENGVWTALKPTDIPRYERTGEIIDPRNTTTKTAWVKSQLQPGMVDPAAGRIPVRGGQGAAGAAAKPRTTPAAGQTTGAQPVANAGGEAELTYQQKRLIKNMLRDDYKVYVKTAAWQGRTPRNEPIAAYLVVKTGAGANARYKVINARTAEMGNGLTQTQFDQLELRRLDAHQLQQKSDVGMGDWVFVKDHRSFGGFLMHVSRITPRANRQPGVYLTTPRGQRDLYIGHVESLYKLVPAATNEWVSGFDDFDAV